MPRTSNIVLVWVFGAASAGIGAFISEAGGAEGAFGTGRSSLGGAGTIVAA